MPELSLPAGPLTYSQKAKTFACPECDKVFLTLDILVAHHKESHSPKRHQKLLKFYIPALICLRQTCVFCNIQFKEKQSMNLHYRRCTRARSLGFGALALENLRGVLAWNSEIWLPQFYFEKIFWYVSRNDLFVNPQRYEEKENLCVETKRRKTGV